MKRFLLILSLIPLVTSVAREPDLIVIGGTPGGIATAVTAARLGCQVTLVEYHRHLGGMSASGLGASDIEHREMIQGFFREFVDRIKAHYVATYGEGSKEVRLCKVGYWYEPKVAEMVFESFLKEQPAITVLKHHELISAAAAGDRITAVTIKDRGTGRPTTLQAKLFADATYEGDLLAAAGAEFRLGREGRDEFGEPHAGNIYNVQAASGSAAPGQGTSACRLILFASRSPRTRRTRCRSPPRRRAITGRTTQATSKT